MPSLLFPPGYAVDSHGDGGGRIPIAQKLSRPEGFIGLLDFLEFDFSQLPELFAEVL